MKKVLLFIIILNSCFLTAQKIGADVLKFSGKVTSTVRDTFDVPTGESWLIWNVTTEQFEVGDDTETWGPLMGDGDGAVVSVNGKVGTVVINPDDLNDTSTTNKFITSSLLSKLSGIEAGAEQNVQSDWDTASGDSHILNKPTLGDLAAKDLVSVGDILGEGVNGQVPVTNGAGEVTWQTVGAGIGDVTASSTFDDDNRLIRSDGTGKGVQKSNLVFNDSNQFYPAVDNSYLLGTPTNRWSAINANIYDVNKYITFNPSDTEPPSIEGSFYADESENRLKYYDGTNFKKVLLDGDASGTDDQTAAEVPVTASGFDGNLDTGDDTVQKVAQKLDDLVVSSGGIVAEGSVDVTTLTAVAVAGGANTATVTITHSLGYVPSASRIYTQLSRPDEQSTYSNTGTVGNITSTTFDFLMSGTSGHDLQLNWAIFGAGSETPLDGGEIATLLDTELGSSDWRTSGSGDFKADGSVEATGDFSMGGYGSYDQGFTEYSNASNENKMGAAIGGGYLFRLIPEGDTGGGFSGTDTPLAYNFVDDEWTIDDQEILTEAVEITSSQILDGTILKADFADGDWGDASIVSNLLEIDANTIGANELISSGVTAGSYTNADITVDVDGRITAASNGTGSTASSQYNYIDISTNTSLDDSNITSDESATGKKIWNRVTANVDSLYIDEDAINMAGLTGSPFIIQNWGADSTIVKRSATTDFYIADSSAAITSDILVIKQRHPVTFVPATSGSFFVQGNFLLYTSAEAVSPEIHTQSNAASDPNGNEGNFTTGWSKAGSGTLASIANPLSGGAGSYALKFDASSGSGGEYASYSFTAEIGETYRVTGRFKLTAGTTAGDPGWKSFTGATITTQAVTTTESTFDFTFDATSTTVQMRLYLGTDASAVVAWDNLSIIKQ